MGQRHTITQLSQLNMATLDYSAVGHMLFLPAPGQASTLSIYTFDDNGTEYHVKDIALDGTNNLVAYLDPTATPYCERIGWLLSSPNSPNIPYNFITHRHGKPMTMPNSTVSKPGTTQS